MAADAGRRVPVASVVLLVVAVAAGAAATCDEHWHARGANCYHVTTRRRTWLDAWHHCRELNGATLASVHDDDDNEWIAGG